MDDRIVIDKSDLRDFRTAIRSALLLDLRENYNKALVRDRDKAVKKYNVYDFVTSGMSGGMICLKVGDEVLRPTTGDVAWAMSMLIEELRAKGWNVQQIRRQSSFFRIAKWELVIT